MTIITTSFILRRSSPVIALISGALSTVRGGGSQRLLCRHGGNRVSGIILKDKVVQGDPAPFVMELLPPPPRISTSCAPCGRGDGHSSKGGTIILLSVILVWFLLGFGFENGSFGLVRISKTPCLR